jgi:hypothetical protein
VNYWAEANSNFGEEVITVRWRQIKLLLAKSKIELKTVNEINLISK